MGHGYGVEYVVHFCVISIGVGKEEPLRYLMVSWRLCITICFSLHSERRVER